LEARASFSSSLIQTRNLEEEKSWISLESRQKFEVPVLLSNKKIELLRNNNFGKNSSISDLQSINSNTIIFQGSVKKLTLEISLKNQRIRKRRSLSIDLRKVLSV